MLANKPADFEHRAAASKNRVTVQVCEFVCVVCLTPMRDAFAGQHDAVDQRANADQRGAVRVRALRSMCI
jgi:hypothetical protein